MKTYEDGKKITYSINPPSNYILKKQKGQLYIEYKIFYEDESVIYITNDYESGGAINKDKVKKFGDAIFVKIAVSDTLDIKGLNEDGKYWREKKNHNIVVGYINVPKERKAEFDKAIASVVRE